MRKVKIKVTGKVQNVGFRFLTMLKAQELNIGGTVQNKEDGSVYIEAKGEDENMNAFIHALKQSLGPASRVDEVKIIEDPTLILSDKFIIQ